MNNVQVSDDIMTYSLMGKNYSLSLEGFSQGDVERCFEYITKEYGGTFGMCLLEFCVWFRMYFRHIEKPSRNDILLLLVANSLLDGGVGLGTSIYNSFEIKMKKTPFI